MASGSVSSLARLTDLPDVILEHIAKYLKAGSYFSFACAHPRFWNLCEDLNPREGINTTIVSDPVIQFVSANPLSVQRLDLSDCWSDSECMKKLILMCPNLTELNVLNSALSMEHLLTVLGALKELKDLSVSIGKPGRRTRLDLYPSIRVMFIEFTPEYDETEFALRFLEACSGVKRLNVNIIGCACGSVPRSNPSFSAELLQQYDTAIITHEIKNMGNDHWMCAQRLGVPSGGFRALGANGYSHYRQMPQADIASSLSELNFTGCHSPNSAESWRPLLSCSSALQAVALPTCSLFTVNHDQDTGQRIMDSETIEALQNLNLKKLHVETGCTHCRLALPGTFAKHLNGFKHLEELILARIVGLESDFFRCLAEPFNVTTLKIDVDGKIGGLGTFMKFCTRLRNLKLESRNLQIQDQDIWDALCDANLRQLCLSSGTRKRIDTQMLRPRLTRLLEKLDIFHLHGRLIPNHEEVDKLIREAASNANLRKPSEPVRYVGLESTSINRWQYLCKLKVPGRSLCCTSSLIAGPELPRWNME